MLIGKRNTGPEVFGGRIWWQTLRPLHMLLWAGFAYYAISRFPFAYRFLVIDTMIGLSVFLVHHYSNGDLPTMVGHS
jgi:hypothetical protein